MTMKQDDLQILWQTSAHPALGLEGAKPPRVRKDAQSVNETSTRTAFDATLQLAKVASFLVD